MEVAAVSCVGSGEAVPAAALEGFLRSVAAEAVAAAGKALVQLLLLAWGSWSGEIGAVTEKEDTEGKFNIFVVRRNKNQATPEMKDDGETDEDEDDDDDDDVEDDDGGEEEFSGDDGNENEGEDDDDPEANGEGGSDDEDDEDDDEDDDGDDDEDEEEDEDEDEEEQPPSKKRK